MLLGSDNRELCTRCHDPVEDEVMATHARDSDADCVACHNPHVGTTRALLKENDDEIALLYGHAD
jgi:predicted CXXCH cytochrome family protein